LPSSNSKPDLGEEETIQLAINTLQTALSADFKATDIEVGWASVAHPRFQMMSEAEIDRHLIAISERD
jgi:20S proteasome subunit alpha 1